MDEELNIDKARRLVFEYCLKNGKWGDDPTNLDTIKIVWFCKTLKNWKALVIDLLHTGLFFEVTYNGEKQEAYIDAYSKIDNVCVPDGS